GADPGGGEVIGMPLILQENLRGLLYAPYYAAITLGAYRQEKVAIELVSAPAPSQAADGLLNGTVDVAWGGPMRVMQTYDRRPDWDLVCVGEAGAREPFFFLGLEPRPGFTLSGLSHKPVAT